MFLNLLLLENKVINKLLKILLMRKVKENYKFLLKIKMKKKLMLNWLILL